MISFLPTPSARRATSARPSSPYGRAISTHALREEGDLSSWAVCLTALISTHALREEGDVRPSAVSPGAKRFLPTPSVRRATGKTFAKQRHRIFLPTPSVRRATPVCPYCGYGRPISTHALREEGDKLAMMPKGENYISTHALREEGDHGTKHGVQLLGNFYPRPP